MNEGEGGKSENNARPRTSGGGRGKIFSKVSRSFDVRWNERSRKFHSRVFSGYIAFFDLSFPSISINLFVADILHSSKI